ncbi:MAG: hypothetical protein LBU39_09090 [Desulfobulbaceae bacterium]|jgi:hypothetical protein|nr:hypothetical protein [Desulfobulbaceae bacterium]
MGEKRCCTPHKAAQTSGTMRTINRFRPSPPIRAHNFIVGRSQSIPIQRFGHLDPSVVRGQLPAKGQAEPWQGHLTATRISDHFPHIISKYFAAFYWREHSHKKLTLPYYSNILQLFKENLSMKKICLSLAILIFIADIGFAVEFKDPLKDYKGTIKKHDANAQHKMIYQAWGNNMAKRIMDGKTKGVVVDTNGTVHGVGSVTGSGNVVIGQDAQVNGPIINMSTTRDTNVISIDK